MYCQLLAIKENVDTAVEYTTYKVDFTTHTNYHQIMAEIRALGSALTCAGVTRDINVNAFVGQSFSSMGDIENINTLS